MSDDRPVEDEGDQLGGAVDQEQLRALKRLEADVDDVRLSDGFGMRLALPGAVFSADLTRSLVRDLVAAGFAIHDCAGNAPGGGVCLTAATSSEGVIVTWTQHDAAEAALGYRRYADIQEQMNYALADILTTMGYPVEEFGQAGANLVTGPRSPEEPPGGEAGL